MTIHPYPTARNLQYRWSKHISKTADLIQRLVDGFYEEGDLKKIYTLGIGDKDIIRILANRGSRSIQEFLLYCITDPEGYYRGPVLTAKDIIALKGTPLSTPPPAEYLKR